MKPVTTMLATPEDHEAARASTPRSLALHLAVGSTVVALSLHLLQLLSLGPWAVNWPRAAAWPTAFHAWLLETVAMAVAGGAGAFHLFGPHWRGRWNRLDARQRALGLAAALVVMQVVLAAAFWFTRNHGVDQLGWLRAAFYLGGEFRIPVFFAAAQAMLASWLAWQLYRREGHGVWAAASAICAYIGADELLSIHERVGELLRANPWVPFDGVATLAVGGGVHVYAWQLFFLPLAALVGLWMLHRLWRLVDVATLLWLTLGAFLFVGGSIGLETVQATGTAISDAWHATDTGQLNLLLEETLETLGMSVALWVFAKRHFSATSA